MVQYRPGCYRCYSVLNVFENTFLGAIHGYFESTKISRFFIWQITFFAFQLYPPGVQVLFKIINTSKLSLLLWNIYPPKLIFTLKVTLFKIQKASHLTKVKRIYYFFLVLIKPRDITFLKNKVCQKYLYFT